MKRGDASRAQMYETWKRKTLNNELNQGERINIINKVSKVFIYWMNAFN